MPIGSLYRLRCEGSPLYFLTLALAGWMLVFTAGVSIPSEPFRKLIVNSSFALAPDAPAVAATPVETSEEATPAAAPAQPARLRGWEWFLVPVLLLLILVSYTPTNLIMLCCLGAASGAYAVRSLSYLKTAGDPPLTPPHNNGATPNADPTGASVAVPGLTAMIHGLCVYLAIVGGLIVVQGQIMFDRAAPDLYLRLSAVATLFSVVAGTNRDFIRDVVTAFSPFGPKRPEGDKANPKPEERSPWLTDPSKVASLAKNDRAGTPQVQFGPSVNGVVTAAPRETGDRD